MTGVPAGGSEVDELRELLADLAMEGLIRGLGDPVAEVNDQTGVLGRVRSVLGSEFLDGAAAGVPDRKAEKHG
jgi:hypothetical protein